ncbi:uncharacterized protein LOC131681931 [Topomyia yanbarensis]|uniref:uncharacterized protein LOC131681931 n=1 Tax=Topomyia yanbarensis TaxID=2498891 RepID=UPI00273C1C49|nr:uncharacterized protein LOC131681931 [Topomyia yanbarensis]XP_058819017.1 uncharacterized protein LOC131681931 [Topomyia yanbarensis]
MRLARITNPDGVARGAGLRLVLMGLLLSIAVVTVGGIPTSVLVNAKTAIAQGHDDSATGPVQQAMKSHSSDSTLPTESKSQISVLHKRGVNPLVYNDLDYSGNSIPRGGTWDDPDGPPPQAAASIFPDQLFGGTVRDNRLRNYDLLASLLSQPAIQSFYGEPVIPSVNYPSAYYGALGDRTKRMAADSKNRHQSIRLKRSPAKMSPADALSLLALLESRDPYVSDYYPSISQANGPNDVLPYSGNSFYQDVPLALALARSPGSTGPMAPYSDADGAWMNTWTEPAVDYLGFPLDVDTLSRLDGYGGKPTKNGFSHQKRFMITKRKRSVRQTDGDDCKNGKKSCLLQKYAQLQHDKISPV